MATILNANLDQSLAYLKKAGPAAGAAIMPDDEYVIRPQRPPTPTNWNLIVSIAAAVAAFMCAVFTAWYAYEARQTRISAEKSGNQQEEYVRQALQASQPSAAAAEGSHEEAHK